MSSRLLASVCGGLLLTGLLAPSAYMYWCESSPCDAWIVEQPEQVITGAIPGQEVHVVFILRNVASQPRRILGVQAC